MQQRRYEPSLDRMDVAIRAVWQAYRNGQWSILSKLGIQRSATEATLELARDMGYNLRTDEGMASFLALCPFIPDAALRLLGLYAQATWQSRNQFYTRRTIA